MKNLPLILLPACLLVSACGMPAGSGPTAKAGLTHLKVDGDLGNITWDDPTGGSNDLALTAIDGNATYGMFVSDNIELGAGIDYQSVTWELGGVEFAEDSAIGLRPYGRYYFTNSGQDWVWGELAYATGDPLEGSTDAGPGFQAAVGVSHFLTENTALELSGQMEWFTDDVNFAPLEVDGTTFVGVFGLSTYF